MEVPFISSGAMNRAHYALVRNVELASSSSVADRRILAEVESIRHRLSRPGFSLKDCRECLVMLLYCSMSISSGLIAHGELDFALRHAVTLTEAGHVQDKRIGYLFCAEMMPRNHELQLMLVNTLRKDLESPAISRICLALDTLIFSSTEDVTPAVQSRLHDLLSHNSPHIRRRALLAFRALSIHGPDILKTISGKVQKRLQDPDSVVLSAALSVCISIVNAQPSLKDKYHATLNKLLVSSWPISGKKSKQSLLSKILQALRLVKLSSDGTKTVIDIIRYAATHPAHKLLHDAFFLLSESPPDSLLSLAAPRLSTIFSIRHLLVSRDPNEQHIFLTCLECLDPLLWAGTSPGRPAVLEGWEVERVMKLLDSRDGLIRKKTLKILRRIDADIIESYLHQALHSMPDTLSIGDKNEYTSRSLDIVEIQAAEDGELYARYLKNIFAAVEHDARGPVLEEAVEKTLMYIRNAGETFSTGCIASLVIAVAEDGPLGATFVVIISALAAEYADRLSTSPRDIIEGLARRLSSYPPTIQDACLLSMLRISVHCEEVPSDIISAVKELAEHAGRYVQRRCDQFIRLSGRKEILMDILSKTRSPSLPDFLEALTNYDSSPPQAIINTPPSRSTPLGSPGESSRASLPATKLRYAAYEPPRPASRLRRPSSSQRSVSSTRSATYSDSGRSRGSSRSSDAYEGQPSLDELSRTVTAGELALAAGDYLEMIAKSPSSQLIGSSQQMSENPKQFEDLTSRVDLIAFDSPFISDPPVVSSSPSSERDFESTWNALEHSNTRGWCEISIGDVVRRLQSLHYTLQVIAVDRPPFEGDLKILISPGQELLEGEDGHAALRLRESEDGSCLWRLRCEDDKLRTRIKRLLTDL